MIEARNHQVADRPLQSMAERAAQHRAMERYQPRGRESPERNPKAQVGERRKAVGRSGCRSRCVEQRRNHGETIAPRNH